MEKYCTGLTPRRCIFQFKGNKFELILTDAAGLIPKSKAKTEMENGGKGPNP